MILKLMRARLRVQSKLKSFVTFLPIDYNVTKLAWKRLLIKDVDRDKLIAAVMRKMLESTVGFASFFHVPPHRLVQSVKAHLQALKAFVVISYY